ncbi:MAG: sigma-54-dependent Fis family transcriptional regulator [Planctomycetes bacterium]|nr:sigma-54-dependent Fis family transcriptional regulator [Planctomycetota bacterium]
MSAHSWLKAVDCQLLQTNAESDSASLRLVQRLLEIALFKTTSDDLAKGLLEEIASAVRADQAGIWEATPEWKPRWQYLRRGAKADLPPRTLLSDILDRQAGVGVAPASGQPAFAAACLSFTADRPNRLLLVSRPRDAFDPVELEYAVAAGHYLGLALERGGLLDQARDKEERLHALVEISRQMIEERETVPLLEHIAAQSAKLLRCERASIFIWDRSRQELVGRPALGMPSGELRLPENTGVVGKVVQTGQYQIVDNVRDDKTWSASTDQATGFETRNLLCVPMNDASGQRLGALEVMNKNGPFTPADVATLEALAGQTATSLANVREREALVRSHNELEGQARLAARIVGDSTAVVALRATVERVARTELPVLILGESGTGKEVVARALHYASTRQQNPFIPVNCAAIAETLLESELFGHEKGAFTDAHTTRAGKFEAAVGGTLFLDEIGDLSAGGQAKLLRVLEDKIVYRVGGSQAIPVDTRIVAATNRNLGDSVRAGKFREDLFYRLTVVTLDLPPLRDRRDDIPVLAEHFLRVFCKDAGRKALKITAEARRRLEQHEWPGNVRELRNLLERIAYLCQGDKVEAVDLAFILRPGKDEAVRFTELNLADATDAFQREHIQQAIERTRGHMGDAAKLLGLHRPNLYRKMKMLGMNPKE